ncbi:hypothetical protein FACS189461_1430 [Spirochaetia bacterium]|nr:hypothetical protein FACS189461_1430 [Spirochaetia bacterium]
MKDGFYCSGGFQFEDCPRWDAPLLSGCFNCKIYRRKHETPEQFKERTGREYPKGGAVYLFKKIAGMEVALWGGV